MNGVVALDSKGRVVKTGDFVEIDEYDDEKFKVVNIWRLNDRSPMLGLTALDGSYFDYHAIETKVVDL